MSNKLFLICIILLLFSCSEEETTIINSHSNLPEANYELNLQSDSGENLRSVTITWQDAGEKMIIEDGNETHEIFGNSHVYDSMNPGEFKDLQFSSDNTVSSLRHADNILREEFRGNTHDCPVRDTK